LRLTAGPESQKSNSMQTGQCEWRWRGVTRRNTWRENRAVETQRRWIEFVNKIKWWGREVNKMPTLWSRVLLQTLSTKLMKEVPAFYRTRVSVHYRIHKILSPGQMNPACIIIHYFPEPILSQLNPFYTLPPYFYLDMILLWTLWSARGLITSGFPTATVYALLSALWVLHVPPISCSTIAAPSTTAMIKWPYFSWHFIDNFLATDWITQFYLISINFIFNVTLNLDYLLNRGQNQPRT
jgi:hypothetical protein